MLGGHRSARGRSGPGETIGNVSDTQEPDQTPDAAAVSGAESEPGTGVESDSDSANDSGAENAPEAGNDSANNAEKAPLPESLTFRITPVSLLAVLAIAVCATPLATTAGLWALSFYLIPVALAVWILRTATTVGPERVRVRTFLGGTSFAWDDVSSLRLDERRWLKAVLRSGKQVTLPAVRVRDLPRLATMSGGRLPDPTERE
jgi:hypothetical protein